MARGQQGARFGTALVTGATGGLGRELARRLAREADALVLSGTDSGALDELAAKLGRGAGRRVETVACDLSQPGAASELAAAVAGLGLTVDTLVNCAGFGCDAPFTESDPARQRALVQVNDMALMELCRAFAPSMAARGRGYILNVASIAGFLPGPRMATYYASKAFVQSFSQALHVELRPSGVHVTALCSGPVRTPFWERADAAHTALAHLALPASAVACAGVRALRWNKALCVPGLLAKLVVLASRVLPRGWMARLAQLLQTSWH